MWSALDWVIDKEKHKVEIDPKYADITFVWSLEAKRNQTERLVPPMLKDEGLFVNNSKTEKHHASKHSDKEWMKCKYLSSLLGTEEDKRQTILAHDCLRTLGTILNSKRSAKKQIENFQTVCRKHFLI